MSAHIGYFLTPVHVQLFDLFFQGHASQQVGNSFFDGKMRVFVGVDRGCFRGKGQNEQRDGQQQSVCVHTAIKGIGINGGLNKVLIGDFSMKCGPGGPDLFRL